MKENLKKIVMIFVLLGVTTIPGVKLYADTPRVTFSDTYLTFEVWQGNGNSSVRIGSDFLTKNKNIVKFDEFELIKYGEKVFDTSNYMVTESGNDTVITLRESYLKTLQDGTYSFDMVFSRAIIPVKLHVVTHKVKVQDAYFPFVLMRGNGSAQVKLPSDLSGNEFYPELFQGLWYKGSKVAASSYSVSRYQSITSITLSKDYVEQLPEGEHYFVADFMNVDINLKLKKVTGKKRSPNNKLVKVQKIKIYAKKKKLVIKWKKQKNVTGYVVKIGTNRKITKNKITKIIRKNKNTISIRGLKNNKKYYLKVRVYRKIKGKKYWGVWSRTVSKKIKD